MSPLASAVEKQGLTAEFGAVVPAGVPTSHTIGLLVAPTWLPSTAYVVGDYAIPVTAFTSRAPATAGRVFKCTTAGTTGATEPTWPTAEGSTVVDGTVVWTEISTMMATGTVTTVGLLEPSGSGYVRPTVANTTANWLESPSGDPSTVTNLGAFPFGTTTAPWGQIIGAVAYDATPTNVRAWGLLPTESAVGTVVGIAVNIPAGDLVIALT